jgi:hypothetical protein
MAYPGRRAAVCAAAVAAALVSAAPAGATTRTVTFDDPSTPDGTRVFEQYKASTGVTFPDFEQSRPYVRSVGTKAHSGDRVGVYDCTGLPACGEGFSTPRLIGQLSDSVNSVSAYVGYFDFGADPTPSNVRIRIRAYNATTGHVADSAYVTATRGGSFDQLVTVTSPAGRTIDSFEITADDPADPDDAGKPIGFDDLSITIDDAAPPPPPNYTLNQGQTIVDVLTGTSVDVPIDINRINGSNGDISFAVSGLPAGMTASFNPNPVTGGGTQTVMTLSADAGAAHSDQYSEITVTATPTSPGAGPTARSITKQVRIRENCTRTLRFDFVDARSNECMRKSGDAYTSTNAEVRINGLIVKPVDDSMPTLVIDPKKQTIESKEITQPFAVLIDADVDIPIYAGPISWDFSPGDPPKPPKEPRKVVHYDASKIKKLKGIPVTGLDVSFLQSGKAKITPTLSLTFWPFKSLFGGITANTQFTTDNDNGADFTGLEVKVGSVNAVAIELKDIQFKWSTGDNWFGSAKVVLKFAKSLTVGAGFGIKNGDFDRLQGSVGNLNVSIGPGVFLQSIGFDVQRTPALTLIGTVGFSGGPSVAGKKAVTVNGALKAILADPFVIEVSGNAFLGEKFKLGEAFVRYSTTGLFEFGAKAEFSIWRLSLDGRVDGWVDGFDAFNVEGRLDACLDVWGPNPCGSARAIFSSIGIAGCVGAYGYWVGAGATWDLDFDAFTGCDLSPYREKKPSRKLHAAAAPTTTVLPKGLPSAAWEVKGDGTVPGPGVTLMGPKGEAVSVTPDLPFVQNDKFRAELRDDGTAFVLVNKPAAGAWTLSDDGRVPVTLVRIARGLPNPSASVRVTGRGRSRVLTWSLRKIQGQKVTFAEIGKDVRSVIVDSTTRSHGSVRFRPADGPAGKRSIVALVEQDGNPRATLTAGSYRAPGMLKPGKPRALKVKRSGSRLVVTWRPNPSGFRHAVYLQLTDRRRIVKVLAAKRRSLTLKGVSSKVGAKVQVLGLTAGNGKGPSATASIKRRK